MNRIQATLRKLTSISMFAGLFVSILGAPATAQNVLATVSIPAASAGQIAVDPELQLIYAGGGPVTGSSLTVINGTTFAVVSTVSGSAGVSVDMSQDNYWDGTLSAGKVNVYQGGTTTQLATFSVGSCPAAVAYDCKKHRVWASSSCGTGNDPVWVFDSNHLTEIGSAITPGGTIVTPPVVSSDNDKLYVTSGGVSREIDPNSFAVTTTTFGTVLAIDSNTSRLFATSGNNLQVISAHSDTLSKSATLTYTPIAIGVNNAMEHVYLLNSAGGAIDVYSETGNKIATFTLPANSQPQSIAVDSVRGRIFVDVFNTSSQTWSLQVIEDLSTVKKCGFAGSCDY